MAVAVAFTAVPDADAQIYTRRTSNGVVEATNVPAERGYQLTYPGKGTLIHSAAWRLRPLLQRRVRPPHRGRRQPRTT